MSRRLKTIAADIERSLPGLRCVIEPDWVSTDRLVQNGGRHWRHEGKGRRGNRLTVYDSAGNVQFLHRSAETYRTNAEVEQWLERRKLLRDTDKEPRC